MSHITDPVRTVVLKKLLDAFVSIEQIQTVKMLFTATPVDVAGVPMPAAYVFEIAPEDRTISNRLAIGRMHLMAQIFFKAKMVDSLESRFSSLFLDMDIVEAEIHRILHTDVGLSKNGLVNIVEIQYDRVLTNDSVGVLQSTFDVEYRHDRGNAFS